MSNPTPPAQNSPAFAPWVRKMANLFKDKDMAQMPGTPRQKAMIAYWKEHRPKMYRQLQALGLVDSLAFVLDNLAIEEEDQNLKSGMGWPDSREQAEQAWLLMEPEEDQESKPGPWAELQQALDHGRELIAESQNQRAQKNAARKPPKNPA